MLATTQGEHQSLLAPHPQRAKRSFSSGQAPAPALSQVAKRRRVAAPSAAPPRNAAAAPKRMADIKDIFGESDSEDDDAQQQAPVDVGKLFELSEDEDEAPIQRKRLQKNAAAAPQRKPQKKDEGGAYDAEDDGVRDCVEIKFRCASHIRLNQPLNAPNSLVDLHTGDG